MSRHKDMQGALHQYRLVTGKKDVDMRDVARFAVDKLGMKLPVPVDPLDRLAREMSRAAREETRYDKGTGRSYRVNHMFIDDRGQRLWLDIDDGAPRHKMVASLSLRREQAVGDAYHLQLDADHWNSSNPSEESIQIELDFTPDVEERKAIDDGKEDAAE